MKKRTHSKETKEKIRRSVTLYHSSHPNQKHSLESKNKIRLRKLGEKNPMWKGEKVGYSQLHEWVRIRKLKPLFCEICLVCPPFDLSNKTGKYTRRLDDWHWICRRCHMISDGRINNLKKGKVKCNEKQQ